MYGGIGRLFERIFGKKTASSPDPSPAYGLRVLHAPDSRHNNTVEYACRYRQDSRLQLMLTPTHRSIVFVHGLNGHREKTWTSRDARAPWPQTLLPSKVPEASILTFGYDAKVTDWRHMVSGNRIADHASGLLASIAAQRGEDDSHTAVCDTLSN